MCTVIYNNNKIVINYKNNFRIRYDRYLLTIWYINKIVICLMLKVI